MVPKILLHGRGKMGQALKAIIKKHPNSAEVIAEIGRGDSLEKYLNQCSLVIDFSDPIAVIPLATELAKHKIPLVTGTTGLTPTDQKHLTSASKKIPIVQSANFSIGINLLFHLVQKAAITLGQQFHPEIVEIHHSEKIDSPSGTALKLAHLITRSYSEKQTILYGRKGICGRRSDNELGIHSVRGGDVVGEHTVLFLGSDERIELCHKASSRTIFAKGAFDAAIWLYKHHPLPNLYSMQDVLNLPL